MVDNKISMPSGMGGLMRYDADSPGRFHFSPAVAIGMVVGILVFVLILKILFPIV